ncbi:predicted protein [Nematostella vectensis]|uniref:Uncharacterized protein n=2 Tax=Nematostella vectensis TaxID=45351 RepID=A7T9T7_NEMVE|nr:predicted protein [Nematostella vectensis]|eukprot:XP_001619337.1 hypothetical protein NEMVEDRAFT_v1g224284 [Nematostella vectensis]
MATSAAPFGTSPPATTANAGGVFGLANQPGTAGFFSTTSQPQPGVFGTTSQPQPGVFGSTGQPGGSLFVASSPGSGFGNNSQPGLFGTGFGTSQLGQGTGLLGNGTVATASSNNLPATTPGPFSTPSAIPQSSTAPSATASSATNLKCSEQDIAAFKAEKFVLGKIPECPPPPELCI